MSYTQEQIEEAIETLKKCTEIEGRYKTGPYKCKQPTMGGYVYVSEGIFTISLLKERGIILAALEAATKECERIGNDLADALDCKKGDGSTAFNMLIARSERAEAYAAKLEKAGDMIRNYKPDNNPLQAEVDVEELFDAWDAARQTKPQGEQ